MATWDDVRRLALALPETTEETSRTHAFWKVRGKGFVWERPLGKNDRRQLGLLGRAVPEGPILGVRVDDLDVREAVLAEGHPAVFSIPHFDGYPAFLVRLELIEAADLAEMIQDAWLAVAPKRVADAYFDDRPADP